MSQRETQGLGGHGSLKSTADLSGKLVDVTGGVANGSTYKNGAGLFAIPGAAGYFAVAGANALMLGVIDGTPIAGEACSIQTVRGTVAKVVSGGVFAVGDVLITDANGAAVIGAGAAQKVCAKALEASTAAGQVVAVMLLDGYVA